MSIKSWLGFAGAGMVLAGVLGISNAQGTLLVDLRQTQTGAKQIVLTPADVNKPINIDVYVQVTGAAGNPEPELFQSLRGTFVSSGGIRGPIAVVAPVPDGGIHIPENPPSHVGFACLPYWGMGVDVDGDGDLDLDDSAFLLSEPMYSSDYGGTGDVLPDGGVEFRLGRISFTPTSLSGNVAIQFKPYLENEIGGIAGLWTEDGPGNVRTGSTGQIVCSDFVIVPEPAGVGLLGLGATVLLRRTRR